MLLLLQPDAPTAHSASSPWDVQRLPHHRRASPNCASRRRDVATVFEKLVARHAFFYKSQSVKGSAEKIKTEGAFSNRLRALDCPRVQSRRLVLDRCVCNAPLLFIFY